MPPSRSQRHLALLLSLALVTGGAAPGAWAAGTGVLSGRVVQADGVTPRAGAVVALFDGTSDSTFRSRPTTAEGTFLIEGAPVGRYDLLVETDGGAYLAPEALQLAAGDNPPLSLALKADPHYQTAQAAGLGGASGLSPVLKWVIIGLISAAALYVVSEVGDDEEPASEF